jgi:two-component system chemotaxis sensor kinase CheA
MDDEMREVIDEFLVESNENLDQLDRDFVTLERAPGDLAVLASVFRTIHTIKGTAGFLAFTNLEALTHKGENLLSRLRDGDLPLTDEITTALLAMVDAVRGMLAVIEATGGDGEETHSQLIARLTELNGAPAPAAAAPVETVEVVEVVEVAPADTLEPVEPVEVVEVAPVVDEQRVTRSSSSSTWRPRARSSTRCASRSRATPSTSARSSSRRARSSPTRCARRSTSSRSSARRRSSRRAR